MSVIPRSTLVELKTPKNIRGKYGYCAVDEAWLYYYDPTIKQQSSEWKHPSSPTLKKAKTVKSEGKRNSNGGRSGYHGSHRIGPKDPICDVTSSQSQTGAQKSVGVRHHESS
ncbi:hypothetical protein TNCV_963761 [Trichonephila clavipes]|nr:hypothetical protein TNCV_963761 [Trichonephila clavipes]